jgi:hypothetical protein
MSVLSRLSIKKDIDIGICVTLLILVAAISIRFAFCFPPHKYDQDSDAVLAGLCAFNVGDGQLPLFFPGGYRLSSQSCYITAGMFQVFGPTRSALAATSVFYGILFIVFAWLSLREIVGLKAALPGLLLVAFPPVQFWMSTYPPWAYIEIMTFCACTLWLGFRLLNPHLARPRLDSFLFGLSVGFSLWTSPQTLMISVPITALLIVRRRLPGRRIGLAAIGTLIALYPYFLLTAYRGFAPLMTSAVAQPVSSVTQIIANVEYLVGYTLPLMFLSQPLADMSILSLATARVVLIVSGFLCLVVSVIARRRRSAPTNPRQPLLLPLIIVVFASALYSLSGAGAVRGWTVRYVAPMFLAMPLMVSLLYAQLKSGRFRASLWMAVMIVVILHAVEYPILFSPVRARQTHSLDNQTKAIAWLKKHMRDVVIGDYWSVYSLNFDLQRSVVALPSTLPEDYFHYNRALEGRQVRAALMDPDPARLDAWVRRIGIKGRMERVNDEYVGFVLDAPVDAATVHWIRLEAR